jgi:sec-independent protein translocase protein TatB
LEILGVGPAELLLVFVLALIFIGPGKMPEVAASLGKAIRAFQQASAELTEALNAEVAAAQAAKDAASQALTVTIDGVTASAAQPTATTIADPPALAAEPADTSPSPVTAAAPKPAADDSPAMPRASSPESREDGLSPLPLALLAPSDRI